MTPDQALDRAQYALTFIRAGKRSMGKENGYKNPVNELAECFELLDREAKRGNLPQQWRTGQ